MKGKERIPLHDHVDNNSGGRIGGGSIGVVGSGGGGGGGGGTPPGGGSGGDEETPVDHGDMGSAETINVATGTWHRGTLDADCTITVSGFTVDEGLFIVFEVDDAGVAGVPHTITWDPDVVQLGDMQPQVGHNIFWLLSSVGDSTVYGARVGTPVDSGTDRRILLADGRGTPFTFDDMLQMDDGSDFMWSD